MATGLKLADGTDFDEYFHHSSSELSTTQVGSSSTLTIPANSTVSFNVPYFSIDKEGHITNLISRKVKIDTGRTCTYCNDCDCDCDCSCSDCD